jgi:hypothetical protein
MDAFEGVLGDEDVVKCCAKGRIGKSADCGEDFGPRDGPEAAKFLGCGG